MSTIVTRVRPSAPAPAAARPPRIALFSGNYNYVRDGANRALNRLVADLEARGATVRVYSPTAPEPAFAPEGTLIPVRSIRLPGRGDYRLGLGLPRGVRADLRGFAPDLVHVSAPDWTGVAAQRYARAAQLPLVASLHTRFETYAAFYGAGLIRPVLERHLDRFYARCDRVLVPTLPILADFVAAGAGDRARLWSRGVDRAQFDPARRDPAWRRAQGIADDACAILFFGRLVREKGVAVYAEVVEALAAAGTRVHPLIVGDGPEAAWLRRRLPDATMTGHLAGDALGRAVASADIFFNPSVTEAFGNVTLEAMAAGLPTVSVDVASARALLAADTGLFYPRDAPAQAVELLARLTMFPDRRRLMGRRARDASAAWSWERASAMVWDAYHELLGDPARAVPR
ncbi:glycosyltransferase family 1 protein [Sphingomonas sp. BK235]|uniref:glycosyltransferase family 4 protein n=1 Tax=Sphingomonas sp. BK235 TaxID=2512131 RepID=UPI001046830F|nr:glycosyltransferase family 1 protein [Sphingomonas sp. BK235]TCP34232.1 glycosyltransferase involved in cell wall biosynthesis [Sphingomonas sp. BK235]